MADPNAVTPAGGTASPPAVIIPPAPAGLAPAVSPTGEAIIPPVVAKIAIPLVAVAAALSLAPDAGIVLPALVLTIAKLVVLLGTMLGIASPGARKPTP